MPTCAYTWNINIHTSADEQSDSYRHTDKQTHTNKPLIGHNFHIAFLRDNAILLLFRLIFPLRGFSSIFSHLFISFLQIWHRSIWIIFKNNFFPIEVKERRRVLFWCEYTACAQAPSTLVYLYLISLHACPNRAFFTSRNNQFFMGWLKFILGWDIHCLLNINLLVLKGQSHETNPTKLLSFK